MNETAPQDPPRPAPDGETQARRDRVDLDHVNVMQQAILERVQREHQRGSWLPRITPLQWALSAVIAAILVAGIFSVVDAGLTAFQRFAEVAMRPQPAPAVEPVQPVDVSQPFTIMVVPESAPAAESQSSSPPQ
ncbi:MAG: hypothetical protein RLZZ403_1858 [Pseudomonadota bacterium]|jgi:hypothetical protein